MTDKPPLATLWDFMNSPENWKEFQQELGAMPKDERDILLADVPCWQQSLPHVDQDDEVKAHFFELFSQSETRDKAVQSVANYNRLPAVEILDAMTHYVSRSDADFKLKSVLAIRALDLMVDAVRSGQPGTLKRLAEIIEGDTPDGGKGDRHHADAGLWRAFCDYFVSNWRLPCKKELRAMSGLEQRAFTRSLTKLGLQGLPQKGST